MTTTADFAASYVSRYGFALVPLPPRSKRPLTEDWGKDIIGDKLSAISYFTKNPDANVGVALGPSRLCSLDIDDEPAARTIFSDFGLDLDALKASAPTIQGSPPGFRIMFRVPEGMALDYHSLTWPKQDGSGGRFTVMELRSATNGKQRQDVLPPSIHPDTGKPYLWLTRPNGTIPEPPAWLLTIWREWDRFKPQLQDACPWAPKREIPKPKLPAVKRDGASVIEQFVDAHDLETTLERYGYKKRGNRWLSPHSTTGLAGVTVFTDSCWIHHASDPLCSEESGQPVNAFDLFCYYEHSGDVKKAVKAAADILGLKPEPRTPYQPPAAPNPPSTTEPGMVDWMSVLESNSKGFLNNLDNVVRVIEHDPLLRGRLWYDEFLDRIITTWQGPEREWKDADDIKLQLYLQRHVGLQRIGLNTCHDAVVVAAFHDTRNECASYLTSQPWDGVDRLAYVMSEAFGTEHSEYTTAVGRCWFISMVARVMRPGCKVDTVPVLEGSQGAGKSTALSIIGGKWFVECHEPVTNKDFYGVLDGHMLVEIAEMHSFTRAEVERIKGIISCQKDRYRKSYGRNAEDHPRKTVLACTTNRDDWQRDDTGARRFWPVLCGAIDHEWLRRNRDQLFAEAVHLFNDGGSWWDVPRAEQEAENDKRRDVDVWEPIIEKWLVGRTKTQTYEVLSECLHIEIGKQDRVVQNRVGRILRLQGWRYCTIRVHGSIAKGWARIGYDGYM